MREEAVRMLYSDGPDGAREEDLELCKSSPCGTYRSPYKKANWSLRQFLGYRIIRGHSPVLSMERLSASERLTAVHYHSRRSVKGRTGASNAQR